MRKLSVALTAVLALAASGSLVACKKGAKKAAPETGATPVETGSAAAGSGSAGSGTTLANAVDPWAGAPETASTLGANTGGGLAQLDFASKAAPGGAPGAAAAMKVDVAAIPKSALAAAAPIKSFAGVAQTGFRVVYNPSTDQIHEGLHQVLEQNKVFETLTESLNQLIRVPTTVDVQLVDCGTINAFYDPNGKRVIVCYELMTYFAQIFKPTMPDTNQLGMAVIGATTFAFFHEIGHGLIHLLDLPAVGREEDSADQLATLILIADGEDGVGLALSGAHWFQLQEKAGTNQTPFSDEHAFDMQRFYNILCMVYGSDPGKYGDFVSSGTLPAERAQRCPEEFAKISHAWEKLLQPFLTNTAAQNVDYKPAVDPTEAGTDTPTWATDDPTAPTAPTAPQPAGASITCEQVAEKAIQLIGAAAVEKAATMTPEEVEELKTQLETQLPAFAEQFLAQCAKDDWPDKDRQCVLDAETIEAASQCGIK